MVDVLPFNGKPENLLDGTSLHLSFTSWSRPLADAASQGNIDSQGSMMESVISIRYKGEWIGDVDALCSLGCNILHWWSPQPPCSHEPNAPPKVFMTSLDGWDNLRDLPQGLAVVRAHGNWVARLSAAIYLAESYRQGNRKIERITICPDKVCWACHEPDFASNIYIY